MLRFYLKLVSCKLINNIGPPEEMVVEEKILKHSEAQIFGVWARSVTVLDEEVTIFYNIVTKILISISSRQKQGRKNGKAGNKN